MKSGTITLYYCNNFVDAKRYHCVIKRKQIIAEWALIYGKKYSKMYFQISPDIDLKEKYVFKKTQPKFPKVYKPIKHGYNNYERTNSDRQ